MSLILKDSVNRLMAGYPTVSDKYNILPGTLVGTASVEYGQLVKFAANRQQYEAISGTVTLADIAGINVATNVKLITEYGDPKAKASVKPGEALNLLRDGFVAVPLEKAVEADIVNGKAVAVILASGKLTTSGVSGASDLPGYTFTGTFEKKADGTIVAEISVK